MPGLIRLKQSGLAPLETSDDGTQSLIYRNSSAKINWDGIETHKRCVFRNWTPGEEYTEVLTFKNLSGKNVVFTYEVPKTRYFQTVYPKRVTLSQGVTFTLPIQFSPLENIAYSDELIVYINQIPRKINLFGLLPQYRLSIEPREIQFGYCAIQDTQIRTFKLKNTGDLKMTVEWSVTDPFSIDPLSCSLSPGEIQTFQCLFQPQWALIYIGKATCFYEQSFIELSLHGIGKFPHLVVQTEENRFDPYSSNLLIDFGTASIQTSMKRDLILINQSPFRVPFRIDGLPGVAKFDNAFRLQKVEGIIEARKKQIVPIKFQPKAYEQDYKHYFNVLTQQGGLVNAVVECSGRSLGNSVEVNQHRFFFGQVLANSKTSRILEIFSSKVSAPARFQIVTTAESPFHFSMTTGIINGDRSKTSIVVSFVPNHAIGYYKVVPILIEYQSPILIELMGTCHTDTGKPPVLNERYLSNFKRLISRHLALYPFEILTDYFQRGKLRLDECGSLVETDEGASIVDSKTIKDDRNYLIPPLINPWFENYSYWFSVEDNARFEYVTLSERSFIFDQCNLDTNNEWQQSLTVTNLTRGKLNFIWMTNDSNEAFQITPSQAEIAPLKSTAFRLSFRPKNVDTFYWKQIEGYAFFKNQRDFTLVPDYGVMCPVQFDITCLGQTLRTNHEVVPKCQLDREVLIFPPIANQSSIFQTLTLTNQGTTPIIYRFISQEEDSFNSSIQFKPTHGFIAPGNHEIVTARFKPNRSSRSDELYQERFVIRLNEREQFDQTLHVFATQEKARVLVPNDGKIYALTTCIGLTSETNFQLKSLSRTEIDFQWHLDSNISSLTVDPLQGSFGPYEEKTFRIIYQPKTEENLMMASRLTCWIGDKVKQALETYHISIHASTREGFIRAQELQHDMGPVALGTSATYDLYLTNGSDCLLKYRLFARQTIISSLKHSPSNQESDLPREIVEPLIIDFLTVQSENRGQVDGKAKVRVPCRIHPFSRSNYQLEIFYILLDDNDLPLSDHVHPLCTLAVHGVYPHLAVVDILGSQQAAALSKNLLTKAFNISKINSLLSKEPTSEELSYAINSHRTGFSVTTSNKSLSDKSHSTLEQAEPISFNFNAAPVNAAPSEVHILLENRSDLDTTWTFLFPKDLQTELEYWARTGNFTEEELNEMKLQDNKIFTVTPKQGVINRGSTVTITLSYKHIFAGQHILPSILKIGRSRQIMLNFVGISVEPGETFIQFYSMTHHLLPVELGAQGAPVQQYELWNGGTVPVHFQVDMKQLEKISNENYGFWVLDCLTPEGIIPANKSFSTQWVFNPLEAREYEFNIKIDFKDREPAILSFVGHGFDKRDPTSDMSRSLIDHIEMTKQLNLENRLASIMTDRIHFGNLPLFIKQRRVTFLKNQSNRDPISFVWHVTNPEHVRSIRIQPVRGKISPRQSLPIKVTFMAMEAPAFHDIDLICEIYNETTLESYRQEVKRWEMTIQDKWERFEIEDEEYEDYLRIGTMEKEEENPSQSSYYHNTKLQMCKTLPPVIVNYELDESNIDRTRRLRNQVKKQMSVRPQMPVPELVHLALTARTLVYQEYLDLCDDTSEISTFFIDTCLGGDFNPSVVRKSLKQGDMYHLSINNRDNSIETEEKINVNLEEADVLRGTLSDLLQSLLSDRVFADTLPEMIKEKTPYFAQLHYTNESIDGSPSPVQVRNGKEFFNKSMENDLNLSERDRSLTWSSADQDKHAPHQLQGLLPTSSTPSSMSETDGKVLREEEEQMKKDPNITSLVEDLIENTLWNILQEAFHNEFSLTARPRLIALPPKRQNIMLTQANLQKSSSNPLPLPQITTESID